MLLTRGHGKKIQQLQVYSRYGPVVQQEVGKGEEIQDKEKEAINYREVGNNSRISYTLANSCIIVQA